MVVVFNVAKSSMCFVEYNSYDSLQAHVIEEVSHSCPKSKLILSFQLRMIYTAGCLMINLNNY